MIGVEKGFKEDSFSLPVHVEKTQTRQINDKRRKQLKMHVSIFEFLAKQELPETFDSIHCRLLARKLQSAGRS